MAQACPDCGGVGYGRLDPDGETGWRSGTPKGQPPAPCPTCQGNFDQYAGSPEAKIQRIDEKGKKIPRTEELTFGNYVDPQAKKVQKKTIQAIDSDGRNLSDEAFDPGVVETGNAKVTIEEALAATAAEAGGE